MSLLINNAKIVNEGRIYESDVLVANGRIQRIATQIDYEATHRVAADGKYLLPGMIDDQVHFREPGLTHKGDIASESAAAVAGGITSYMDMPNVNPPTIHSKALIAKHQLASEKSLANYGFYLGATNDNLEDIRRVDPQLACGVKVFMGASTGSMLVDNPRVLEHIFADSPVLIVTHCEHTPTILVNEQAFRARYGDNVPMVCHPEIRSVEACYLSSSTAIDLAKRYGARLHVLHLTTEKELSLFSMGEVAGKSITAEVCIHHLFFSDADYQERGTLIKCNPAIKSASDRTALLRAVAEGRIDVIATDHAPHTWDEKQQSYFKAPSGLPLVQHALVCALELVSQGQLSLTQLVEKTSHNVARCFQIEQRGFIREGFWADLVLVALDQPTLVTRDQVLYKCGWSPFEGILFRSKICATWVNGDLAYESNRGVDKTVRGQPLRYER